MTKQTETKYHIRNWKEYNKALIQRGSITLWFSEESIKNWNDTSLKKSKGRPRIYSDEAILCALLIRTVYHLPLRALQGFLFSLILSLGLKLLVPSYSQICRRARDLQRELKKLSNRRPCDIVFDSTGLKVYGEGEWKVRQHGVSKRRTWRKLHIGIDPQSSEILVSHLTGNGIGCGDGEIARKMITELPKGVKRIFGDGAYDDLGLREKIEEIGAEAIIPPPRGAAIHRESKNPALMKRNDAVREIKGLGNDDTARKIWKIFHGYHRRSLVETAMYRIKQLTGSRLRSREYARQQTEAHIKCLVVNKMSKLGMPVGVWVKAA
jgi:IS5 family transposase